MEKFEELEYTQSYNFLSMTIQEFFKTLTVLIIANATIIGFAIEGFPYILYLGAIIQFIILLANYRAGIFLLPLFHQIIKIEKKYQDDMPLIKMILLKLEQKIVIEEIEKTIKLNSESKTTDLFAQKNIQPSLLSKNAKSVIIILLVLQLIIPTIFVIINFFD